MSKTLKILIADDHKLVRRGIRLMLESQNVFKPDTSEASNGYEVLHYLENTLFDVVLLDITMPDMDGLEVLQKIRVKYQTLPVLMLSMHNEENVIKRAIDMGASGYLLKNSDIDEIVKAITTVISQERYFSNDVSQILLREKPKRIKRTKNTILSDRELEILQLIVKEMTSKEIAEILNLSYRTIEGHRNNIMEKLKVKTTIALVKYAMKHNIDEFRF